MSSQYYLFVKRNRAFTFLNKWRITSIFGFFYVVVNLIFYVINGNIYPTGHLYTFLTTWFNWSENWDYTSVRYGFLENFGLPFFFVLMAEYYSRNIQQQQTKNYLSIDAIFAVGVIATYIMTGLDWYFVSSNVAGQYALGSGSSVVAFTFFVSYLLILLIDSLILVRTHSFGNVVLKSITLLLTFVLIGSLSLIGSIQDFSKSNHLVGLAVFCLFVLVLIVSRCKAYSLKDPKN